MWSHTFRALKSAFMTILISMLLDIPGIRGSELWCPDHCVRAQKCPPEDCMSGPGSEGLSTCVQPRLATVKLYPGVWPPRHHSWAQADPQLPSYS